LTWPTSLSEVVRDAWWRRGSPGVAAGTVFEAAHLVGVELYGGRRELAGSIIANELALLPQRGRSQRAADNDF